MNEPKPEKQGMSCIVKGLLTCAVASFVCVVGGIIIGYYVLFHTAVPAKMLVKLINQNPNVQIEGITGSISSGFAVESMRFKDDNGNTNALDDVRLKYEKDGDTIVITEVHVGRGYFYVDRSKGEATFTQDGGKTTTTTTNQSDGDELNVLVKSVSINDITVEDVGTGEKFNLEGIQLANLSLGKEFSMGELSVKCTALDLKITPKNGEETGNTFDIDGVVKPAIHKNLTAPINLKGSLDGSVKDNMTIKLVAFDGKFDVSGSKKEGALTIKDFSFSDYFKNAPPITNLNLSATNTETVGTAKGTFTLGTQTFTIDQKVDIPKEKADKLNVPFIATSKSATTEFIIKIYPDDMDKTFFPTLVLSTTPAMTLKDAVSSVMTGKAYATLAAKEKKTVDEAMTHFREPKPETAPAKK